MIGNGGSAQWRTVIAPQGVEQPVHRHGQWLPTIRLPFEFGRRESRFDVERAVLARTLSLGAT